MKNISIFASDKISMHPNDTTVDGLGIATEPYSTLPLDVSGEELKKAAKNKPLTFSKQHERAALRKFKNREDERKLRYL